MTTRPLVLLLTFGTGGDLQPFIVLAAALAARGYRTLLVVQRSHEQVVQATGLPYVVFGTHEQSESVLNDPDLWDERKGLGVVWRGLLPSLDEIRGLLVSHAQAGDCVVLSHPFLVPVAAMAKEQQAHLRIVCAYLAPSTLRTVARSADRGVAERADVGADAAASCAVVGHRQVLDRPPICCPD